LDWANPKGHEGIPERHVPEHLENRQNRFLERNGRVSFRALQREFDLADDDRVDGENFKTMTSGVNFYPIPRTDNIKIGAEVLYMFDASANSIVDSNTFSSVRSSPDGGQVVFRLQAVMQW
jgi:hypothetical protein